MAPGPGAPQGPVSVIAEKDPDDAGGPQPDPHAPLLEPPVPDQPVPDLPVPGEPHLDLGPPTPPKTPGDGRGAAPPFAGTQSHYTAESLFTSEGGRIIFNQAHIYGSAPVMLARMDSQLEGCEEPTGPEETAPAWLTTELPPLSRPSFAALPAYREAWDARLRQDRFVLLVSPDEAVLMEAAYAVCDSLKRSYARRLLALNLRAAALEEAKNLTLDRLLNRRAEVQKSIVVVEAEETEVAGTFLDAFKKSAFQEGEVRSSLLGVDGYLVILTTAEGLGGGSFERLPYFSVPAVEIRLRSAFGERYVELLRELERQRCEDRWPGEDRAFLDELRSELAAGTFEATLASRGHRPPPPAPRLQALLELERATLFLATFLPGLPVRDFEELLLALVEGRQEKGTQQRLVRDDDGGADLRDDPVSRPLADRWSEDPRAVLEACQLEQRPGLVEPGTWATPRVELKEAAHREALRQQFLSAHYLAFGKLLERLLALHPLLDPRPAVYKPTIALLAEVVQADPGLFGVGKLGAMLAALETHRSQPQKVGSLGEAARQRLWGSTYLLLRTLQESETQRSMVAPFLNQWIGGMSEVVLFLAKRLRYAPGFDELVFCRQVLDRGTDRDRARAIEQLLRRAQDGPEEMQTVLARLAEWFSKLEAPNPPLASLLSLQIVLLLLEAAFLPDPRHAAPAAELRTKIFEALRQPEPRAEILGVLRRALFAPHAATWLEERAEIHRRRLVALWLGRAAAGTDGTALFAALALPFEEVLSEHLAAAEQRLAARRSGGDPLLFAAVVVGELVFGLGAALQSTDLRGLLSPLLPSGDAPREAARRDLPIVWAALREALLESSAAANERLDLAPADRARVRQELQEQRRRLGDLRELHAAASPATTA